MLKVLVIGFGFYGVMLVNLVQFIVEELDGCIIVGVMVILWIVFNMFFELIVVVQQVIVEIELVLVIMLGEYLGCSMIIVE